MKCFLYRKHTDFLEQLENVFSDTLGLRPPELPRETQSDEGEGSVAGLVSGGGRGLCGAVQGEANMEGEWLAPAAMDGRWQKSGFLSMREATAAGSVTVTKRNLRSSGRPLRPLMTSGAQVSRGSAL